MARRARTARGEAELTAYLLSTPDTFYGDTRTPSLFTEDDAPTAPSTTPDPVALPSDPTALF